MPDPTPADIEAARSSYDDAPLTEEEKLEMLRSAKHRLATMEEDLAAHLQENPDGSTSSFIAGWNEGHMYALAVLAVRFQRAIAARVREAVSAERTVIAEAVGDRAKARHRAWEQSTRQCDKQHYDACATECEAIEAAIRARGATNDGK